MRRWGMHSLLEWEQMKMNRKQIVFKIKHLLENLILNIKKTELPIYIVILTGA